MTSRIVGYQRIYEGFENRKFTKGTVQFAKSSLEDPFLQGVIDLIVKAGRPREEILKEITDYMDNVKKQADLAPLLFGTAVDNIAETGVFNVFWESDVPSPGPKFSTATFYKLVRSIRADHDEFLPLRGFIDRRRLTPKISYTDVPPKSKGGITTAAATPTGEFIFNTIFMQKLMDYSHLKGLKPKGKKYVSNGGDIPDEYGYIEFLIMHEFMHYSNDDFYYQKIIPDAKNKVINWVGDFRTNYLLVKSGYEQLPMGLFNDDINYDRQKTYVEMYNLVLQEFEKLPKPEQIDITSILDGLSDDHTPGSEQVQKGDGAPIPDGTKPSDIDENGKTISRQMENSEDSSPDERKQETKDNSLPQGKSNGKPGSGGGNANVGVDYTKIMPTFNWKTLIARFLQTATTRTEETYAKPHRRNVSNLDIARQVGAGAIRPAEKPIEYGDVKLAFCFDSSGSMGDAIGMAFSNAVKLLSQPAFRKSTALVLKFSGSHDVFKCNFYTDKAAQVTGVADKPKAWPLSTKSVFSTHMAGGTAFSGGLITDISQAASKGYNVIIFTDGDVVHHDPYRENLVHLIKQFPKQMYVIFDERNTYISFRQKSNLSTPNVTYFS